MKKLTPIVAAMVCAGMLAFSSCDKDDKDDNNNTNPGTTKTKKDYLLEGKWQMTYQYEKLTLNGEVASADSTMDDCEKDNISIFLSGGKIAEDEGSMKCDASDPQTDSTSTWVLSADYNTLTVTTDDNQNGIDKIPFKVTELSASDLKLEWSLDTNYMGMPASVQMKVNFKNIK